MQVEMQSFTMQSGLFYIVLLVINPTLVSSSDNSGGCVYSFEVWKPNQDVLKRMQMVQSKCENTSRYVEQELLVLKNDVLKELLYGKNLTHRVEKEILQQKLDGVQNKMVLKEIQYKLGEVKSLSEKLTKAQSRFDEIERKLRGDEFSRPMKDIVREQTSNIQELVGQLKNSVGDLKAEWLLIKRDVQVVKSENEDLRQIQGNMKADAISLKELVGTIQSDTQLLKTQQNDLKTMNNKLRKGINELRKGNTNIDTSLLSTDDAQESGGFQRQVKDLKKSHDRVSHALHHLKRQNSRLKRELMTIILELRNVSQQDVSLVLSQNSISRILRTLKEDAPDESKDKTLPQDCHDVFKQGHRVSSVYQIKPIGATQLDNVYCEMINNTGWTVFQRRVDGTISFNRRWLEYKHGFGNLYGEFWLGNQMLHWLTHQKNYKMRVELWDWEGQRAYAEYDSFKVDGESENYRLRVRGYSGNAGDSLSLHDQMAFSTEDMDNDLHRRNCAAENKGGWWFNSCYSSNLNGIYHTGWYTDGPQPFAEGVVWYTWKESEFYSLKRVELKLRPRYL